MSIAIIVLIVGLVVFVAAAIFAGLPIIGNNQDSAENSMRAIVAAQRASGNFGSEGKKSALLDSAADAKVEKIRSSRLTLVKLLKYAQWKIPPLVFRVVQLSLAFSVWLSFYLFNLNIVLQLLGLSFGFVLPQWILNTAVDRRFRAFEKDYASFLMSLVGLLKTGMNPMSALQSAGEGLEEDSLVRSEIELLLERLRIGVSEDLSIGAFGEDVFHPEIELFVQALLLSRRVGGNLSDTLERLARQVRRRQQFREAANGSVAMQRYAILVIMGVLSLLEFYIWWAAPDLLTAAFYDDLGWQVLQTAAAFVLLGLAWIRQIVKIKV